MSNRTNAFDPQGERLSSDRRADLAREILLTMTPHTWELACRSMEPGYVERVADDMADLAVTMADALQERLTRKD